MDLNQIKKEAREEFKLHHAGLVDLDDGDNLHLRWGDVKAEIDHIVELVVDELEKVVTPEEMRGGMGVKGGIPPTEVLSNALQNVRMIAEGWNECRDSVQEAFTRFKGENK